MGTSVAIIEQHYSKLTTMLLADEYAGERAYKKKLGFNFHSATKYFTVRRNRWDKNQILDYKKVRIEFSLIS